MKMVHDVDPAQVVFDAVGSLEGYDLFHNLILLGGYKQPERSKSGLYLPEKSRDENKWQGKAWLVLGKGPGAFVDDGDVKFHGKNVEVGDWIGIRPSDGWLLYINGHECRMIEDVHVRMRIPAPDDIF